MGAQAACAQNFDGTVGGDRRRPVWQVNEAGGGAKREENGNADAVEKGRRELEELWTGEILGRIGRQDKNRG